MTFNNDTVNVTPRHPVYAGDGVTDRPSLPGFREIGSFVVGDPICLESFTVLFCDSVAQNQNVHEHVTVYNLNLVDGPPTYFANGFAVHNC